MQRLGAKLMLLVITTACPTIALCQEWLNGRYSREGPGIRVGNDVVFHPGLGLEGGYDTNALRTSTHVTGAGKFRITPYLDFETRSQKRRVQDEGVPDATPPKLQFRLGTAAYYDFYFADDPVVDRQDNLGVDIDLRLVALPDKPFTILADLRYTRSLQPYESNEEHWAWHMVRPGIGVRWQPGKGTLSFELGYRLDMRLFEDDLLSDRNDKMEHELRFITAWKLLPKTALIQQVRFAPIVYFGDLNDSRDTRVNNNSLPVRTLFGIQGLFTDRFGLGLFVGYGGSFYAAGDDFSSVIANGELMFFITPFSNIRVGGQRDFVDSFYANFFVKDGGYLKFEQMFAGIVLLSLQAEVFHRTYATYDIMNDILTPNTERRKEIWFGATLLAEARATDWLSFHVSGQYLGSISNYGYLNLLGEVTPSDFQQFEVLGGVRVHY